MSRAGERTVLIEPLYTEDGFAVADRARLADTLDDLAGTLLAVGGELVVQADRVKIGELPGAHDGKPTILAETVGFIVRWTPSSPMSERSRTAAAMAVARRDGPEPDIESPLEGDEEQED
jgi:hypothetical protein